MRRTRGDLADTNSGQNALFSTCPSATTVPCILVLIGATADGHKELIAVVDGYRESEQSWMTLLLEVKARGLVVEPKLAIGDGALGFWKALAQVFSTTREQRCTVHKTANVLDKLPKRLQPQAKAKLNEIWQAETRAAAETRPPPWSITPGTVSTAEA